MEEIIILQKGESIQFLDYKILNSLNNDGLVLMKENGEDYEHHLGNYGTGTKENIDYCKRDAVLHFMLARPDDFAQSILGKLKRKNSGTMHEYFKFKGVCYHENIILPEEITCGDGVNCMIYFNGFPLTYDRHVQTPISNQIAELKEIISIIVTGNGKKCFMLDQEKLTDRLTIIANNLQAYNGNL